MTERMIRVPASLLQEAMRSLDLDAARPGLVDDLDALVNVIGIGDRVRLNDQDNENYPFIKEARGNTGIVVSPPDLGLVRVQWYGHEFMALTAIKRLERVS